MATSPRELLETADFQTRGESWRGPRCLAGKGSPWASEPPERAGRGRAAESALGWAALGDGRPTSRAGASPGEPDRHADCSGTPPCPSSARPAGLVRPSALLVLDVHKPHLDNHPGGEASRARTQRRQNRARGCGGTDEARGRGGRSESGYGGPFRFILRRGSDSVQRHRKQAHTLKVGLRRSNAQAKAFKNSRFLQESNRVRSSR